MTFNPVTNLVSHYKSKHTQTHQKLTNLHSHAAPYQHGLVNHLVVPLPPSSPPPLPVSTAASSPLLSPLTSPLTSPMPPSILNLPTKIQYDLKSSEFLPLHTLPPLQSSPSPHAIPVPISTHYDTLLEDLTSIFQLQFIQSITPTIRHWMQQHIDPIEEIRIYFEHSHLSLFKSIVNIIRHSSHPLLLLQSTNRPQVLSTILRSRNLLKLFNNSTINFSQSIIQLLNETETATIPQLDLKVDQLHLKICTDNDIKDEQNGGLGDIDSKASLDPKELYIHQDLDEHDGQQLAAHLGILEIVHDIHNNLNIDDNMNDLNPIPATKCTQVCFDQSNPQHKQQFHSQVFEIDQIVRKESSKTVSFCSKYSFGPILHQFITEIKNNPPTRYNADGINGNNHYYLQTPNPDDYSPHFDTARTELSKATMLWKSLSYIHRMTWSDLIKGLIVNGDVELIVKCLKSLQNHNPDIINILTNNITSNQELTHAQISSIKNIDYVKPWCSLLLNTLPNRYLLRHKIEARIKQINKIKLIN